MISNDTKQRDIEWFRSRIGFLTGSKIADIMKTGRKEEIFSDTAKTYLFQIAGERLFNPNFLNDDDIFQDYLCTTNVTSKAMQWGIDNEDDAKEAFRQLYSPNAEIQNVSLCQHDTIPYFAASPDGIIYGKNDEDLYIIEVKCPSISTFIKYKTFVHDASSLKETEPKYYWQMQAEMSCTNAGLGFFVVYNPWLSTPVHYAKITREDKDIKKMEERVVLANEFINDIIMKKDNAVNR